MMRYCLSLLLLFAVLCPTYTWAQSNHTISITLEHATQPKELTWGLMGRTSLPPNHGMTFTFSKVDHVSAWMFNCYMDLSVAFLDSDHTITEIRELKCHPNCMDRRRPVKSLKDMAQYPPSDPIYQFFSRRAVVSTFPSKYMVEMPAGWFEKNGVKPGDKILWNDNSAYILITP